jgi:chromosome segregation ATPase/predicted flap endonuclease-1-like 5' DNA nuclease
MNDTLVFAAVGIALLGLLIGYLIASGVARSRAARAAEMTEANTRLLKKKVDDRDRELTTLRSQVATLTAEKTAIDEQEKAAEQSQDEAQAALAAMEDRLNAALAERLAADADRADLRDALALANAEIATLSAELDDAAVVRRQLDEAQQKLNTQLRKVSEQLADEQARRTQEHVDAESTVKAFLLSARAATQANNQIDYATTNADLLEISEPDDVRRAFRALAAVKSQADSELEVRHAELLDAEGKISSMRYSLNILSAAGASFATSYASSGPQPTQQAAAISAATLAELDLLHMRIDALQADLNETTAQKIAIEAQMQERAGLLDGLKARIAEALVTLQPVIVEGESDELAATNQEQAEQELDEPVDPAEADDLAALDGSTDALEMDSEVQPELALQGDAPVLAAMSDGSAESSSIAALPEADRLAAGVATVLAVFGRKNGALSELRASLEAETNERQRLAADLQAHLAEFDGIQVRLGELSAELEGVLPTQEPQSEAGATDEPDDTAGLSAVSDEAPVAVEETSAPEADGAPVDALEPAPTHSTVDRLALGVASVIAALRGKDADLDNLRSEVDALTAARSAAEDELNQNQAKLAGVTDQLSGWIDQLRTRFADDPDVLALLNASAPETAPEAEAEAEAGTEAGQEVAPDATQTSEPIMAEPQAEPMEEIAETAAPVAAMDLLGMGIAAVGAAFDKKDGSLAELSLLKAQLEESLQQRDSALTDLAERITTVQSDLQGVTGDAPELAAIFTAPAVAEEAPAETTATEPAPTGEQEGDQATPVQGEDAAPEAESSPVKRALAGLAVVSTGVAALGGALRSRNDSLTQLQGNVDELTAAKSELESGLQQRDNALGDLAERITAVQSDLQGVAGDAPELAAIFAAPVAAEEAPAETAPDGEQAAPAEGEEAATEDESSPVKRALAGLAVVSTGVAALGGALRSRNDSLTQLQGNVDELTAAKSEAESGLQQRTGELTDLAERITAVQSDLQGVAGDAPELAAIFAAPVVAEEAPAETAPDGEQAAPAEGEEATPEAESPPVKRALAGLAVVSTGVAALGGALRSRNESLTQLQGNVDELTAAKSELESGLQQQTAELTELADRITAVQSDLQGVAVGIPALEALFVAPPVEEGAVDAAESTTTESADAEEAESAAELSPAARALAGVGVLAGGVAAFGAVLRDKDSAAAKLQDDLAAMSATQSDLQTRLDQASANVGALRDRVAALADEFQLAVSGDADFAALMQPATDETALADTPAVDIEAAAQTVDASAPAEPAAEASEAEEDQPLAEALAKLAAMSASVAAIGRVLVTKNERVAELTAKLDDLTSTEADLTSNLGQAQAELGQIDEQLAAWRTDLQSAVVGDADLEAQLQPSADQPEAAGRLGLLAAGVVVSKEALQRRADALSQLQGSLDETVLAKTQLEESLAASDAELNELRAKIAATREALRAAVADDDELAALFDEQPTPLAVEGEVDDATRSAGVQVAPVVSSSDELSASTAAALAAFAKKNDAISRLQTDFGDLSANNAQLEEGLHERDGQLTDLTSRIADWHAQLQTALADDPDALSMLAPAEDGDAAEGAQPSGALLLGASAAAVGAALVKKNSALDAANTQIAALEVTIEEKTQALAAAEAQVAELQSSLEASAAELSALNEQVASLQGELDAAVAAKAELEQQLAESEAELDETMEAIGSLGDNLRGAVGDELEIGETADDDQAPRARRLAKVGALAAGVAAISAAINSKNEELTQANNKLAEIDQQMASMASTQEASDAALQEKDAALGDLQMQLAAAGEQVTQLQSQLDETLGIKTQLEGDLQQRQADLDGLLSQIAAVQADLQAGLDEDEDLKVSFDSRSAVAPELEAAIGAEGEEAPLAAKVAGVGMLTAGVAAAMDAIRKKNSELGDANSRFVDIEAQMSALVADKGALEISIQDKDLALANAQGLVAELQASLDGRDADLASLNTLKEQLDAELVQTKSDSEQTLAAKETEIESLNTRFAELQAELESTQLVKAQLETDVQTKLDELAQLQQELAQTKETADNDIAAKVAEIATLTAAAAVTATTIKQKNDELDAANAQIATLQQQITDAQAAQERLNATVQQKDKMIDAGLEQVEGLQGRLTQRNNEIARLQDENSDLQAETRKLQRQVNELQNDLEQEDRGGGRGRVVGAAAVGAVAGGAIARRNQPDAEVDQSSAQLSEMQRQMAAMQAQLAALSGGAPAAGQPEATASRAAEVAVVDAVVTEVAQPEAEAAETMEEVAVELEAVEAMEEAVAETEIAEAVEEAVAETEIAEAVEEAEEAVAETEVAEAVEEAVAETEIAEAVEEAEEAVAEIAAIGAVEETTADAEITDEATETESRMAEIAVLAAAVESADSTTDSSAETDAPVTEAVVSEVVESTEPGAEATSELEADLATAAAAAIAVEALSEAEEAPADEAADAQAAADVEVRVASVLQDLARVHGIGAVLEQRLYQAGIGTFWELATASKDELTNALALSGLAREGTDLDALQADAARLAQETNSVGLTWDRSNVDDFKLLPKLGDTYKRRLYEAGLINYEAIANSTPEELAEICKASKINPPDFEEWVLLAMEIVEKRAASKE